MEEQTVLINIQELLDKVRSVNAALGVYEQHSLLEDNLTSAFYKPLSTFETLFSGERGIRTHLLGMLAVF